MTEPGPANNNVAAVENDPGAAPAENAGPGAAPDPAALVREAAEYKDKMLRTLADMENLRRRTERDVADARTYAIANFARDLLGVADNMRRALESARDGSAGARGVGTQILIAFPFDVKRWREVELQRQCLRPDSRRRSSPNSDSDRPHPIPLPKGEGTT